MARCAFSDFGKRFHRVLSPQSRLETYYWVNAIIINAFYANVYEGERSSPNVHVRIYLGNQNDDHVNGP